ncbi:hypothetical protein [Hymenobacter lapidiphilus]|uniref:Uncharacterized protein n=1 Tax=Hymenobacter lapidiphilus TaxID=2608003 RepID=A0A7Y7PSJ7_9BACT|nr:hypothetical protein [Hymenobacter lapidiphilus]NVO33263.1 hypothetical protein [Hymenobacter lapidiphilus]
MTHWQDSTGPFQLPTGWHEVAVRDFCALASLPTPTREGAASVFAGRPIQVNALVADALAFLNTTPPTEGGLPYPANLGTESFLQVERIRAAVTSGPLATWLPSVYGLLVARQNSLRPAEGFRPAVAAQQAAHAEADTVARIYPAVAHCVAELERLSVRYAELGQECVCDACTAAKQAGLQPLEALSYFNTLDALAQRLGCTVEAVGQMPYDTVAMMLLRAQRQHQLQARIHQNGKTV